MIEHKGYMLLSNVLNLDSLDSRAEVRDSISESGVKRDSVQVAQTSQITQVRHEGEKMPFAVEQADGVFFLLLVCFLFFTHVYHGGVTYLKEKTKLLFSFNSERRVIYSQITAKETFYSYFLVAQAIVLISICLYDCLVVYSAYEPSSSPLLTILMFIVLIALFYGFKDFLYRLLGYIFDVKPKMTLWRQKSVAMIEILGILYFIPILLLLYANVYNIQIFVFMGILFLIVQIIFFYQIIIFFIEEKFNFLCLIAYLCTFEILPYVFLIIGAIYLYRIDVLNIL